MTNSAFASRRRSVGLMADELDPGVVAGVVDDVRRRVAQVLDDAGQPAVEALEELASSPSSRGS